jgi:hypothetical protein
MTSKDPLLVVRAYHDRWTAKDFGAAIGLLAPDLAVEVPINAYPTRDSFGEALARFGTTVKTTDMISELRADDEVMLLYDMDTEQLGRVRVAEHFTVKSGQIIRIRQIHDTWPMRAAGMGQD